MDTDDQLTNLSVSGHDSQEAYVCTKCGWPFPNSHPSAKHRRAHKKLCGNVEGYKLIPQELQDNSNENSRTPSPDPVKESISGGVGNLSRAYSGSELFSDAKTEFSDISPPIQSDKSVECFLDQGQSVKVNAAAVVDESEKISPVLSDTTYPAPKATRAEELKSSSTKKLTTQDTIYYEADFQFQEKSDIKDEQSKTSQPSDFLVVQSAASLPFEETKADMDTNLSDKNIQKDAGIIESVVKVVSEADLREISDVKAVNEAELQFKVKSDVKDSDLMITDVESVSEAEILKPEVKIIGQSSADVAAEDLYDLSLSNDFPVIDNSEVLIEDFKDHKAVKSKIDMCLDDLRPEYDSESCKENGEPLVFQEASQISDIKSAKNVMFLDDSGTSDTKLIDLVVTENEDLDAKHEAMTSAVEVSDMLPKDSGISDGINTHDTTTVDTQYEELNDGNLLKQPVPGSADLDLSVGNIGEEPQKFPEDSRISFEHLEDDTAPQAMKEEPVASAVEVAENLPKDSVISDPNAENIPKQTVSDDVDLSVENEGEEPQKISKDSRISTYKLEENKADVPAGKEVHVTSAVEVSVKNSDKSVCEEPVKIPEASKTSKIETTDETKHEECHDMLVKQPSASADVDLSVDSISQSDSLEGNWGSVSVLSVQSDIPLVNNTKENNLLEDSSEKPKTSDEITAKTEKQHTNLKNLLTEANSKTNPISNDVIDKNGNVTETKKLTSAEDERAKVNVDWNSPAKHPSSTISKEKRKSKLWVPFMCCSSVKYKDL